MMRRYYRIAFAAIAAACGGTAEVPSPPPVVVAPIASFRLIAGGGADTIGARAAEPITVAVADGAGRPSVGATVQFSVIADPARPHESGVRIVGAIGDTVLTATTSSAGVARADVDFGARIGSFAVRITVDKVQRADTVNFTVRPGQPVKLTITTRDTMATVNVPYRPAMSLTDRLGNPRADVIGLETNSPCQADAASVTAATPGRCTVYAQYSALRDSFTVSFVPSARVIAIVGTGNGWTLATMNLDGSNYKPLRVLRGGGFDPLHPVRGPNRAIAVMDVGTDNKTHVAIVDSAGASMAFIPVVMPAGSEQNWPRFSPDGLWVYFSGCSSSFEACRVWRTHLDGSSPTILTPIQPPRGNRTNYADITPDGTTLLYGDSGMLLHTLNLVTGQDRSLGIGGRRATLDPTGRRIAFIQNTNDNLQIMNLDGTGLTTVSPGTEFSELAEWLPDGQWIVAGPRISDGRGGSRGDGTHIVNVSTGATIKLSYRVAMIEFTIDR